MTTQTTRFTDNGDDTITDSKTGLVWSKKTITTDVTCDAAEKAVAAFGKGWRIPTVDELQTIIDRTRYSPAINTDIFPDTHNDWYWTATPCAWDKASAVWIVSFDNGDVYDLRRNNYAYVRAVRAGQ
jgi:hypothetical protein